MQRRIMPSRLPPSPSADQAPKAQTTRWPAPRLWSLCGRRNPLPGGALGGCRMGRYPHSWEGGMPRRQRDRREEVLRPLLAAMDGEPVPYSELVEAGRMIAAVLVTHRLPVILNSDGAWSGVWDLEQRPEEEAVAWGMGVAKKAPQEWGESKAPGRNRLGHDELKCRG